MGPADTGDGEAADEVLMVAYARGDAAAFARLYARHKGPTYRYFLRHTSDRGAADELHQDVWLNVVRGRDRYAASARFTTWLYTLARNRLVDHWRARRAARFTSLDNVGDGDLAEPSADGDPPASALDPVSEVIGMQAGQRLHQALADLPAAQRDAFLLHLEAGLSIVEVAALCGVPAETIKSRLRYAYRRLRTTLEDMQ